MWNSAVNRRTEFLSLLLKKKEGKYQVDIIRFSFRSRGKELKEFSSDSTHFLCFIRGKMSVLVGWMS